MTEELSRKGAKRCAFEVFFAFAPLRENVLRGRRGDAVGRSDGGITAGLGASGDECR